jgi:hypothetical protein
MGTIDYRFVIANPSAASAFTPGDLAISAEHWFVTSQRGGTRPFIAQDNPVRIDGQEVDLITGKVTDGLAVVRIIDIEGTTGAGTPVNEEFNDSLLVILARGWSLNYAGAFPGNPWTTGFVEPPYAPGSGTGPLVGGTQLVGSGEQSQWMRRTFTAADGIAPLTTYTVDCRYVNFGSTFVLPWGSNIANPPVPFLEAGGTRVNGSQYFDFNPSRPPGTMSVSATSDSSGNLTILVGYERLTGAIGYVIGFDWIHITPGNPAVTGPYATINLADANARQQFLGRQAYIEASYDRGATWPHCLHSGYVTGIQLPLSLVYEYQIGDTRRTERITKAFVKPTTHFDNITCLIGGPTLNGWDPLIPYFGFPTFSITSWTQPVHGAAGELETPGEVVLTYQSGPMPDKYHATGDNLTRENFDVINERARPLWMADASVPAGTSPANGQRVTSGSFPRLTVQIVDINGDFSTGAQVIADEYTPLSWFVHFRKQYIAGSTQYIWYSQPGPDMLLGEGGRLRLPWNYDVAFVPGPNIGGTVKVAVYTKEIGPDYPLHIAMHPVDIVKFLYADYGILYDTTSADDTKNALGSQLKHYARVTAAENIQSFIEKLFGGYGFSTRVENGKRVFFMLRRKSSSGPTVSVVDATLREEGGPTYDLSESTKCNQVRVRAKRFLLSTESDSEQRAWDDIEEKDQTVVADLVSAWPARSSGIVTYPIGYFDPTLDAATFGERVQEFEIPGQMYIDSVGELPFLPFARGLAETVFDRAGRGIQGTTLVTRREAGADDLQLGNEVAVGISHHPNAQLYRTPSSQRGGFRTATVLRREEQPEGVVYTVSDAGTGTVPTDISPLSGDFTFDVDPADDSIVIFDIHPDTGATRNFAEALVLANARIEIQIAFSASAPTTDGIHLTTIDPAEYSHVPSLPSVGDYQIRLGPFETTTALWARIRTFVPGTTPSAWTTWESIAVGLPPGSGDISALVVGTVTDTTIPLSWTNTDTSNPITVYISPDGLNQWVLVASLPAGSTQYTIVGLTPGTDYDIRVILAARGTTLSADVTTTNSGLSTLPTPINASAFVGSDPNVPPGTPTGIYGMRAQALFVPSMMIFEYAVETAVGSGIPDTFHEWTREPSVSGGLTTSQPNAAANDGKLRYVRAKLRASGYNDSGYTVPIGIDPWLPGGTVPIVSPGNPIVIPPDDVSPAPPGTIPTPVIPPPGSAPFRATAQLMAFAVATNTAGTGTIQTGRLSVALRISSNGKPVRVRIYDTDAARTADAARADSVDSSSGDGIVLEAILTSANAYEVRFSPRIILGSTDRPASGTDTLYYSLHNLSTGTEDIQVDLDLEVLAT